MAPWAEDAERPFDLSARWVRVTGVRRSYVLFVFTLGDPDLSVEMVMPYHAFASFAETQKATVQIEPDAAIAFETLVHGATSHHR